MADEQASKVIARYGFFPIVTARSIEVQQAGGTVLAAGGPLSVTQGGGQLMVTAAGASIREGGVGMMVSGGDVTISKGGAGAIVAGTVSATDSFFGVVLAGSTTFDGEAKVLLSTPQAAALGVGLGAALAIVAALVGRLVGRRR